MLKSTMSVDEGQKQKIKATLWSLSVYELHKRLVNDYLLCRRGATSLLTRDTSRDKRDIDVIRENHQFLWNEEDAPDSWEARLAKKYYDKLFKEYCICDLSRYKENKVAMRWRTEQEVIDGKGQFSCGEKHCKEPEGLRTWEVNFAYKELGEKKNALVKLRLCPDCTYKLNYHHKKREVIRTKKRKGSGEESTVPPKKTKTAEDIPENATKEKEGSQANEGNSNEEENIWREGTSATEEKSRDEEFQDYLEELFM